VHAISTRHAPGLFDGVRWHRLDLADPGATAELLRKIAPERLLHLAWYVEHGRFWSAPENVVWVERSLVLLRAFQDAGGRRAVMLGTCAEYDWSGNPELLVESETSLRPASLYGVAKDALRRVAESFAETAEFELAWARLFFIYGPREQQGRLVPAVIRALLAAEPVATTRGEQVRDFMHVRDVAGALAALLLSPVTGAVNIASGSGTTVGELISEIASQVGAPELVRWGELPERPDDPHRLVGDGERLREEVGYRVRIGLAEGVADTLSWWVRQ
jgi:nucleoside-diphosphate-sugar epimerase